MLIRDIHHPHGNAGRIAIHRLNALVLINEDGVIDTEKARKINRDKPKADASTICKVLLQSTRYQRFAPKKLTPPKAAAAPAPPPEAPPAAPPAPDAPDAPPLAPDAPPATTSAPDAPPAPAEGEASSLPSTPQTGDLETFEATLAAKSVTKLSVGEIEAALKTGQVPQDKAMSWLAQESARKPKRKQRKTLLVALQRHIKKAA